MTKVMIAIDPNSKATLEVAQKSAKTNANVLIYGETGVGKEVVAHYIHCYSNVSNGPFISVNCAALPETMIESILFGYEKGAFTGAITSYAGKFEQAQNGTLLLDEISEIPLELQAKLLRVLQEKEVERLGGKRVINLNARIIATTNRDLYQQVENGQFRKDLYYRLNVIPVFCAALRNRPLDIIPLAEYFIDKYVKVLEKQKPMLTEAAKTKLLGYSWPGNVREMENIMHRTLIMINENVIDSKHLEIHSSIHHQEPEHKISNLLSEGKSKLKENETKLIIETLAETNGRREMAAKKLNISARTLRYKLSKLKAEGLIVP